MTSDNVVDLSHYQTNVGFSGMKNGGISAVILKASQGITFIDPMFAARAREAAAIGLLVGAYHYFDSSADPLLQASHFLSVASASGVRVLAIDYEPTAAGIGESGLAVMCQVLRERTGRWPLLYTGKWDISSGAVPTTEVLFSCPLWLAEWTTAESPNLPPGWTAWVLWQFESKLNAVPGVSGECSRSRFNGTVPELNIWWRGIGHRHRRRRRRRVRWGAGGMVVGAAMGVAAMQAISGGALPITWPVAPAPASPPAGAGAKSALSELQRCYKAWVGGGSGRSPFSEVKE